MCHPGSNEPRNPLAGGTETTIELADGAMPAFVAAPPAGIQTVGSVLVIGDIWGARTPFYEDLAGRLAARGLEAMVPEYFHRVGPLLEATYEAALARKGRLDENQALVDLGQAIDWQRGRGHGTRVGVVGCCLGGTFALDLAAERQDLATVCFYGFPAGSPGADELVATAPLDRVPQMSGPLRGFWGSLDERVGIANVERLVAALDESELEFQATILPGLDHGFLQAAFDPDAAGHSAASAAWEQAAEFLSSATR